MRKRPMKDLFEVLIPHFEKVEFLEKEYCFPVYIETKEFFEGGVIEINSKTSSQFISSILMVAPLAKNDVTIKIKDLKEDQLQSSKNEGSFSPSRNNTSQNKINHNNHNNHNNHSNSNHLHLHS
jgi:hypothetical protein